MEKSGFLDPDARIDLEKLENEIDRISDHIPMPRSCAVVEFPFDEFANTTVRDLLNEIAKQPRNCKEYGKWISAIITLIAYVSTEMCRQSGCAEDCAHSCE